MADPRVKVKVLGLKKVTSLLRKEIIRELRSKEVRRGIADIVIEAIRNNPIPVTSEVTKSFREYFEQFNTTHPSYRRSQINFTFTGQLLEDLRTNVRLESNRGKGYSFIFEQSNRLHKGYKFRAGTKKATGEDGKSKTVAVFGRDVGTYKSGSRKGQARGGKTGNTQKITFQKISEYLKEEGYDYLNIDDRTLTKADDFIQFRLTKRLRKFLKSQ